MLISPGSAAGSGAQPESLLRLEGITKSYGSLIANDKIDIHIRPGEIHAVLGENGAGKSTLMKIIFGVTQPNAGTIYWKGRPTEISSPARARALGIGMVFQHFSLFETITVAENISFTVPGDIRDLSRRIRAASETFGLAVEPDALVYKLSVGERQRVELVRCLLQEPSLLILDEPTSVLTPQAVEKLFVTLRMLSDKGIAILYISHKLEEIRALCHSATILRHGQVTGHVDPREETSRSLAKMMIGRDIPRSTHAEAKPDAKIALRVSGLSTRERDPHAVNLKGVCLEVRRGEIFGIAGVSGNGQQALSRFLSGEETLPAARKGEIEILGDAVGHLGAAERRRQGLSFIPEERLGRGAAPGLSLNDNMLLTGHRLGMVARGFIRKRVRDEHAERCIREMDVRCGGSGSNASSLSGGNLQKFIVGREMMLRPKVMVVAQPTWGIDIGAATMVRQKLVDLRDAGVSILLISEELEELFEISDRMAVMFEGRMSPPVHTRTTTPERIGQMMVGVFDARDEIATEAAQ
ncbi:ABC transporter ATP-binding protein [Kaistia granuli]|uniref:ABC transporter ATP-binding protein n=1 Tax=Kaistia granuli TaxID=363259 RepID=UPI000684115F|nr:ABC transporter ATP-binding protein [Kaistia granuli]